LPTTFSGKTPYGGWPDIERRRSGVNRKDSEKIQKRFLTRLWIFAILTSAVIIKQREDEGPIPH
jgi:hypothetical protein